MLIDPDFGFFRIFLTQPNWQIFKVTFYSPSDPEARSRLAGLWGLKPRITLRNDDDSESQSGISLIYVGIDKYDTIHIANDKAKSIYSAFLGSVSSTKETMHYILLSIITIVFQVRLVQFANS